jgi:hypothetical protein
VYGVRCFLNAGERVRLFRTAEDRARPEQDRRLDAAVFYAVALQGMMQVAIIVVMTRFRIGV